MKRNKVIHITLTRIGRAGKLEALDMTSLSQEKENNYVWHFKLMFCLYSTKRYGWKSKWLDFTELPVY